MSLTGVTVNEQSGEFVGDPTPDTGTAFVVGAAPRGPEVPTLIPSQLRLGKTFGGRVATSYLHDGFDVALRSGASRIYVIRDIAADAVAASKTLNNAGATAAMVVTAPFRGAAGNSFTVAVTGTGPFTVSGVDDLGTAYSYTGATVADVAAQAAAAGIVTITAGVGGGIPAVAASSNLTGGSDGSALSTTTLQTALATADARYGAGQVVACGYSASAAHNAIADHVGSLAAGGIRRHAIVDAPYTGATKANRLSNAVAAGVALQAHAFGKRCEMVFPPVLAPSLTAGGQPRQVPGSPLLAGLWAASDTVNPPGTPLTGADAQAPWLLGVVEEFETDAERDALNNAGVTLLRMRPGQGGYRVVTVYDDRAVTKSERGQLDRNASDDRLLMAVRAELLAAVEPLRNLKIDANGKNRARIAAALTAPRGRYWEAGLLGTPGSATRAPLTLDQSWVVSVTGNPQTQTWDASVAITIARTGEQTTISILNQPTAA